MKFTIRVHKRNSEFVNNEQFLRKQYFYDIFHFRNRKVTWHNRDGRMSEQTNQQTNERNTRNEITTNKKKKLE